MGEGRMAVSAARQTVREGATGVTGMGGSSIFGAGNRATLSAPNLLAPGKSEVHPFAAGRSSLPPDGLSIKLRAVDAALRDDSEPLFRAILGYEAARRLQTLLSAPPAPRTAADFAREMRWNLRRWSLKHILYRARLPFRRRRWARERIVATHRHFKNPAAKRTYGPAVAFGEFQGIHGLGRAAAYDVRTLQAQHSSLTLVDIGPYLRGNPPRPLSFETPVENVYFLCQPDAYGAVCGLMEPKDMANAWRLGRWVWETPIFPEDWRFATHLLHEIWAPSEFCAATFREALGIPVRVAPHAVTPPPKTNIDMRARLGIDDSACLGVSIMDIRSCPERKNPWAHVRAWKAAFGDDPRFPYVLKLRVGKRSRVVLDELLEIIGEASNIRLLPDDLDDEEIAALHHAADLFMSLHRSEGFGLNIYEALLLGKPVVAIDWSANAEFGPDFPNYMPVAPEMTRCRDWTRHYADDGFFWAASAFG